MKCFMKKTLASILMVAILIGIVSYAMPAMTAEASSSTMKLTVKHPDMNKVKLSWSKVGDAAGYHVYYKANASGTYEMVSETQDNKIVFEGLQSDHFYYYRIEAYKWENGKKVVINTTGDHKVRSNKIGIDVSKWNGTIDWNKVKNAGIEYAIVRISDGISTTNELNLEKNIEGAQKAGIDVGVYIFSRATTVKEAQKEADFVLERIKGYKLEYPVAFDIEAPEHKDGRNNNAGRKLNTDLTKAFCEKIEAAGYDVMVYTDCNFSRTYLNKADLSKYDLWIAHYGSNTDYTHYKGSYHYGSTCKAAETRFWQYTAKGTVDGIKGVVDMNYELDLNESIKGIETYDVSVQVSEVSNVHAWSNGYNSIALDWSGLNNTNNYVIYRSESRNGSYKEIANMNGTSYRDYNLKPGKEYFYRVYGLKKNGSVTIGSPTAATVSAKPVQAAPNNVRVSSTSYNSITLTWDKAHAATSYKVYMSTSKNGTYKKVGTTSSNSFTHKKLNYGQKYYYKVAAICTVNNKNYWSEQTWRISGKPALSEVKMKSATAGSRKATLKWKAVDGAKGYVVYRSTSKNGSYKKVATVSKTNYTNTGLTRKKKYYYKVRAYRVVNKKTVYGGYSSVQKVTAK